MSDIKYMFIKYNLGIKIDRDLWYEWYGEMHLTWWQRVRTWLRNHC